MQDKFAKKDIQIVKYSNGYQGNQRLGTTDLKITDCFGGSATLRSKIELYSVKDFMGRDLSGLALELDVIDDESVHPEPYATLTKWFREFIGIKSSAYINTGNCPFADQLLEQGMLSRKDF